MPRWNDSGSNGKGDANRSLSKSYLSNYSNIQWSRPIVTKKISRVYCLKCNTTIKSKHRHDMVWCKCGAIAVDGGSEYLKLTGKPKDIGFEYESI